MMCLRCPWILHLSLALVVAGCGGGGSAPDSSASGPRFGPHDGPVVGLPGGAMAEVAIVPEGSGARVVAYFYASESLSSALSPAPSDVRVELAQPGGEPLPVTLTPSATPDASATRFDSPPGDYVIDPLMGTLHATVKGEAASVPFSGGQN